MNRRGFLRLLGLGAGAAVTAKMGVLQEATERGVSPYAVGGSMSDPTITWMAGNGETILYTSDDGYTWTAYDNVLIDSEEKAAETAVHYFKTHQDRGWA